MAIFARNPAGACDHRLDLLARQPSGLVASRWRLAAFFGGIAALFVALISPVEELSDHIFPVHRVEHMLLRSVAPMLLFLSAPQAVLVRGSPTWLTRLFAGSGWLRRLVGVLRFPPLATLLFLLSSYFWMIPYYHDMAIENEPIHYLWHLTLPLSGNIVLGAFLSFKNVPLYSAYLLLGHMWHVSELTDEQTGGIIMWIPGTMMFAISAIWIVYSWGRDGPRALFDGGGQADAECQTDVSRARTKTARLEMQGRVTKALGAIGAVLPATISGVGATISATRMTAEPCRR